MTSFHHWSDFHPDLMLFNLNENKTAISDAQTGESISYVELTKKIRNLSLNFSKHYGSLVLFEFSNSIKSVLHFYALLGAGLCPMVVKKGLEESKKEQLVLAYKPEFEYEDERGLVNINEDYSSKAQEKVTENLLLPTSGSTGSPKYVRLTKANLWANAWQIVNALEIHNDETVLAHLPLSYSYGLSVLNSHLLAKSHIVLTSKSILDKEFWTDVIHFGVTTFPGVPFHYDFLIKSKFQISEKSSLRKFTQAGGALNNHALNAIAEVVIDQAIEFWVMYGQTEATARITVLPSDLFLSRLGSVGKPLLESEILIDENGEINIFGPQVMLGYATSRNDLNGEDVNQGMLSTGDIGFLDDKFLTINGRVKRISKLNGNRLNLDEIERDVSKDRPISLIERNGKIVIFCESELNIEAKGEISRLTKLPMSLLEVVQLDYLPRTSQGKIDYEKLKQK